MPRDRNAAFTLIELLVVIAITGILVAVALPNFGAFFEKSRVKGVTEDFAGTLRLARSDAMLTGRTVFLNIVTTTPWCLGFSDTAAGCNCDPSTGPMTCLVNGQDRHIAGASFAQITISGTNLMTNATINNRGIVTNNGWVEFTSGSTRARVIVSPIGRISMCSGSPNVIAGWATC